MLAFDTVMNANGAGLVLLKGGLTSCNNHLLSKGPPRPAVE